VHYLTDSPLFGALTTHPAAIRRVPSGIDELVPEKWTPRSLLFWTLWRTHESSNGCVTHASVAGCGGQAGVGVTGFANPLAYGCESRRIVKAVSAKLPCLQPLPNIGHLRRVRETLRPAESRAWPGLGAAISVPAFSPSHFYALFDSRSQMEGGRGITAVARSLEMSSKTLANWVDRARRGQALVKRQPVKPVSELEAEVSRLRQENSQLKVEKEIPKKAAAYFAKESM